MKRLLTCALPLLTYLLAACSDDVSSETKAATQGTGATGGAGGSAASGGSGGIGDDGPCTIDADCGDQEVCIYADGLCGDGAPKTCEFLPPSCPESPASNYCDCDGAPHAGPPCALEVDTRPGACPAPQGDFWCGDQGCSVVGQYCELAEGATCTALPPECQVEGADCTCFGQLGDTCECTKAADGHFEVQCYPTF